jgi:hypothetical protein
MSEPIIDPESATEYPKIPEPPHPNLIPVLITGPKDLEGLAAQMKRAALDEPDDNEPIYSQTSEEASERRKAERADKERLESIYRHLRFIYIGSHLCSLTLTLDKYVEPHRWHLSMCEQIPISPTEIENRRIPDTVSKFIASTMLGKDCEEIPNDVKTNPSIRHFVANTTSLILGKKSQPRGWLFLCLFTLS